MQEDLPTRSFPQNFHCANASFKRASAPRLFTIRLVSANSRLFTSFYSLECITMRFAILLVALALVAAVFSDAAVVRRKRQGLIGGRLSSTVGALLGDVNAGFTGLEADVGRRR